MTTRSTINLGSLSCVSVFRRFFLWQIIPIVYLGGYWVFMLYRPFCYVFEDKHTFTFLFVDFNRH